jgi:probable phosphomutase (TIGR03848 family)
VAVVASRPRPAPPALLCLVRHATTPTTGVVLPGRAAGLRLSPEGRVEAERVAGQLAGVGPVAALYCSPLARARETAAAIATRLGLAPVVDRRLVECDYGEWTGGRLDALRRLPDWSRLERWPSGFRFPGGESLVEVDARLAAFVADVADGHRGEVAVAVSHADCIRIVAARALGVGLDGFHRLAVAPASVTAIAYGPGAPRVLCIGSTGGPPLALLPRREKQRARSAG